MIFVFRNSGSLHETFSLSLAAHWEKSKHVTVLTQHRRIAIGHCDSKQTSRILDYVVIANTNIAMEQIMTSVGGTDPHCQENGYSFHCLPID